MNKQLKSLFRSLETVGGDSDFKNNNQLPKRAESEDVMDKLEMIEMIELLVAALDEAEQALADGGVYDQRPYGWLGDNGLRARAIALLAAGGQKASK